MPQPPAQPARQDRTGHQAIAVITVVKGAGTLSGQPGSDGAIDGLRLLLRRYLSA